MPKVDEGYKVNELFVEALVPIVQDAKMFRDFSLELGYRYSDYSTSGGFNTYKGLLNWAFTDSLRIRGGYNRAVRAPNVWDLFQPQRFNLGGQADICAGLDPSATFAECQNTGMTPVTVRHRVTENPAGQYNTLVGGNPALIPETADTITAGVVWTPQNIPGLSVTLDYYNISITDAIGSLGPEDIIQQCAASGDPATCALIFRDRLGSLWLTRVFGWRLYRRRPLQTSTSWMPRASTSVPPTRLVLAVPAICRSPCRAPTRWRTRSPLRW